MTQTTLHLDAIRIDGGTQCRAELDEGAVTDYAAAIRSGADFPSVVVFFDGKHYWLADGFHRYHAHKHAGAIEINADVRNGTKRDAVLFSVGANAVHGLRRSNADKRKAVETLLRDKEWSQWSDREIAKACGVTHPFVASIREPKPKKQETEREKPQVSNHQQMVTVTTAAPEAPVDAGLQNEDFLPVPQKPVEKPEAPAVTQAPVNDAQDEIMRDYERLLADNQRLTAIVESTDAGKAALAEVKRLTEVVRVLEERNRGLMNEKNRALEQAKIWMRKAQRAEKAAKEAAEGVAF
jgi:uncharacterized ParB-like nuclease family protein